MRLVGDGTVGADIRSHPVSRVRLSNPVNNNIAPLADSESNNICGVWLDWHEIVRNNGEIVTVNCEALNTFGATVDQP